MKRNACQKCVFAVRDDNPHCGLRGFRSDFNVERCSAENDTVPNGYELQEDGYFSWVEKKNEYPKTFLGCCDVLGIEDTISRGVKGYKAELFDALQKLYICRDAYWKIAGEEMGFGKPWKPEFGGECYYQIGVFNYEVDAKSGLNGLTNCSRNTTLAFPTAEMQDAFYENFKELINSCKELL